MPIYEYVCSDCGHKFEQLRPCSQANEKGCCPKCKHPAERRLSRFASFTKGFSGESAPIAGAGGGCASCGSSSCGTCGH